MSCLILLAVSTVASSAEWRYNKEKDEMRGVTNEWASLMSENAVNLSRPYDGGSYLNLVIRNMPKKYGVDVYITLSKGQLQCSYSDCRLPVKFDDGKILTYRATRADGGHSDTIFISDSQASAFIRRTKAAKRIIIEPEIWRAGATQFVFEPKSPLAWDKK